MIAKLKIAAYVILFILAAWFGWGFHSSYATITPIRGDLDTNAPAKIVAKAKHSKTNAPPSVAVKTNLIDDTNAATDTTNAIVATNDAANSNLVPQPIVTNTVAADDSGDSTPSPAELHHGESVRYLAGLVAAIVGLGLLLAYDLTHFMGTRSVDFLFEGEGEGARDPEYERAEAVWAAGKPLEAIELMREFLKKNPREQHAAIRIAEIYEKDLHNHVAASLEYEEVLKHRLSPERWGWAAIHLCNVYSRMGQAEKRTALLQRIVSEYPKTGAAKKARRTLGLAEPEEAPAKVEETPEVTIDADGSESQVFDLDEAIASTEEEAAPPAPEPKSAPAPESSAKSNLPPGFRPKK